MLSPHRRCLSQRYAFTTPVSSPCFHNIVLSSSSSGSLSPSSRHHPRGPSYPGIMSATRTGWPRWTTLAKCCSLTQKSRRSTTDGRGTPNSDQLHALAFSPQSHPMPHRDPHRDPSWPLHRSLTPLHRLNPLLTHTQDPNFTRTPNPNRTLFHTRNPGPGRVGSGRVT